MSARSNNIPVSGLVLLKKASDLALGIYDFKAHLRWWQVKQNHSHQRLEGNAPTNDTWYKLHDIFNTDEFGLFFQALQNKTLETLGETCTGGKHSKVRLTGISVASAAGEELPLHVSEKVKNLRCFKKVKSLPCMYKAQTKSWMDSDIITDWIKQLLRIVK